jgi:beta-phosphoglucomutase-like phosphatase (HAD superfamily)
MIKALIFDMDGLLLDTEKVSKFAWQKASEEYGFLLTDDIYFKCAGRSSLDVDQILTAQLSSSFPINQVRQRRYEIVDTVFERDGVEIKSGAIDIINIADSFQVPCLVATSTRKQRAITRLSQAGILNKFAAIIAGDEVSRGKPDPDIFLLAAKMAKTDPKNCLAFEDSEAGIRALFAAHIPSFLIPDLKHHPEEVVKLATYHCKSLLEAKPIVTSLLLERNSK